MIYVTVPGDTVSSISRQSGVPVWKIIYDNQLGEEGELTVGQALLLLKPQESAEIREDLYVTGMHILLLNLMCWRWHFRHSMNCLCFLMALRLKESWFRPYRMKHG